MFSNISDIQFATLFVCAKKDKISKMLGIDMLDVNACSDIIYKFIIQNKDTIWDNCSNKYDLLFDEVFFAQTIDILKKAQKRGTNLICDFIYNEPRISFVS